MREVAANDLVFRDQLILAVPQTKYYFNHML